MESVFILTAIAGVTEGVKRAFDRDYRAVVIIVLSAVVGLLAGLAGIEGLTAASGLIAGLSATGLVTVATRVG